jgi:hypothetical protein
LISRASASLFSLRNSKFFFVVLKCLQIPDSMFRLPREPPPAVQEVAGAAAGEQAAEAPSVDELTSVALQRMLQMVRRR